MGERTLEESIRSQRRSMVSRVSIDLPYLLIVVCLLVFGLMMVYSASWDASILINKPTDYVFNRQIVWVIVASITALTLSQIDYHQYGRYIVLIMLGMIGILFFVLLRGETLFGSTRTLFNGSFQPSELAKLSTIIYLAFWLSNRKDDLNQISNGLLPLALILGFIGGLIFVQPDLSAAATIIILGILLFFLAGGDWKQLILVLLIGGLIGFVLLQMTATGKVRISQYLNGLQNPILGSYHIRRTFEAIIKGQIFGVGIGEATTKFTGLPLAHSDSIFAVIAEETGLVGGMLVILAYVLLLWRGVAIARKAPDQLGSLLALGLTGWICLEALMNIAVICGLFPFTGNALPLLSAGGSSMVTTMSAIGIVMNVSKQSNLLPIEERSMTHAPINLRRRDWRRRVSRSDRFGDAE
ncbi:MAG: FtsW/RodA/SpoVE family cell cycle protein [Anaerolineaceae bacterium]|nr:FtsW/RodA/SpoVE family cell cycle protein [Anaerolineaceae bacterium]